MSDRHEHEKPKPQPAGGGPKERDLAVQLTVAILHTARMEPQPLEAVEKTTLDVYRRVLHAIGPAGGTPPATPHK